MRTKLIALTLALVAVAAADPVAAQPCEPSCETLSSDDAPDASAASSLVPLIGTGLVATAVAVRTTGRRRAG